METGNFFEINGTLNHAKKELINKIEFNKVNSDILFSIIHNNPNLLSDDEFFAEVPSDKPDNSVTFNFMNNCANYHINIKYFTLALLCLIFDITITKGAALFFLSLYGVDYSIVKLDDLEKCIAYKIKTEKRLSAKQLASLVQCNFTYHNKNCGKLNRDGSCRMWKEDDIQIAIDSLIAKKVVVLRDGAYEIIF